MEGKASSSNANFDLKSREKEKFFHVTKIGRILSTPVINVTRSLSGSTTGEIIEFVIERVFFIREKMKLEVF